ncbi:MAG: DUF4919 domain-containing protein [Flavobacterium sp.]|uniref:DUF4919 domain-containing protein n=1 Tax=Flavobacterium sp. TaxID=239 RepID=UPI003263610D
MKRFNQVVIFIFLTLSSYAQKNQDSITFEEKIKLEIENPSSQYFYPNLLNKINTIPESISKEDLKFLYYGQIYKKGSGLSFLDNPNEDNFRKAVMQNNCNKIIKLGYLNLEKNPVELTTLVPVCECQLKRKTTDSYYLNARLKIVLETILDTGDGHSKETAIKIANIEDDLLLKEILEFKGGKETFETLNNRIFSVWDNGNEKIYFEDSWNYKYN